ncbi:ABC transporter related protein [Patulibacter medicamentivorans]|uniref:ABC-type quaternary amine transporter n=1 Tax=Patulibacter medicamentivorans TaxID=1097667 RepID=H0DZR5_9ACTN|nr:ABC transporter ATP-binding protein [Patulibacter medicamentivorans]EHN13019.1 ABC transporter related protein [Patulibacter medicamentivorans]
MSTLEVHGVRRRFGATTALDGVDLEIAEGTLTAILGPSGCGKTTLLRIVAGFLRADAGSVRIASALVASPERHVRPEQRRVGYVPQEGALFPHQTVAANVAFGLPRRERRARTGRARVAELLELVGLPATFADRRPDELSGGQQQRVALARALAPKPSLVLLDEPFASLDARLREDTGRAVAGVLHTTGATGLLVTHDQDEALSLADHVAVMDAGRIIQHGTPQEVYAAPASRTVAGFLGATVLLPAEVRGGRAVSAMGSHRIAGRQADGPGTVLVRPEHVDLVEPGSGIEGTVLAVRFHGHAADIEVRVGDHVLLARAPGTQLPGVGDVVHVVLREPVRVFPAAASADVGGRAIDDQPLQATGADSVSS